MSKDYPKPVESGELLTINNLITKWAQIVGVKDGFSYVVKILIDPADGFADDAFSSNLRYELEAYLAQEKAKWVAELRQQLERSKKIYVKHGEMVTELNEPPLVITTDYKYMVDWSVIAKLLDKKGGENE